MSFFSGVRNQHVYGWFSLICFTSAVVIAVRENEELQTLTEVAARCGENVTLTCNTSTHREKVVLFEWLGSNKTCRHGEPWDDTDILCQSVEGTSQLGITMTLLNVMPANQREYICKLRSTLRINDATTVVRVQDCFEHYISSTNESHASCWFSGVYPSGVIHWFKEDVNLTDSASTWDEEDGHGRYNVSSRVAVPEGNMSAPFNCALWIPSAGKYLTSQNINVAKALLSSGDMVKLQWSFMLAGVMMVKFTT